jgi:hypothetical protein
MSKKPPKAKKKREREPASRAELIEARVLREREWCWATYVAGYPYPVIRTMTILPPDQGGLGYALEVSTIKTLVAEHRAERGEIIGTRAERIERRQMRLDQIALNAQEQMRRAAAGRVIDGIELPGYLDEKAAKVLLEVMAAEGKMHGDDAALRIEAEVTTRDGVLDELNEALAALDLPTVDKVT